MTPQDWMINLFSFVWGFMIATIVLFFYYTNKVNDIIRIHNAIHRAQGEQIDELYRIIGEKKNDS